MLWYSWQGCYLGLLLGYQSPGAELLISLVQSTSLVRFPAYLGAPPPLPCHPPHPSLTAAVPWMQRAPRELLLLLPVPRERTSRHHLHLCHISHIPTVRCRCVYARSHLLCEGNQIIFTSFANIFCGRDKYFPIKIVLMSDTIS